MAVALPAIEQHLAVLIPTANSLIYIVTALGTMGIKFRIV